MTLRNPDEIEESHDIFPKSQKSQLPTGKRPLPRTPGTPGTTPWPSVERSSVQVESKVLLQNVGVPM